MKLPWKKVQGENETGFLLSVHKTSNHDIVFDGENTVDTNSKNNYLMAK